MLDAARLRRILDVGHTVVSHLDLEAVLDRVLHEARELTGARYAALGILDEQRRGLERFLAVGIDAETHRAIGDLPHGRGVLGVLISDPRPLRLDDVGEHPRSYGFPVGHPRMRTFLGVPIVVRGEAYGNLYLTEKAGGAPFDADDEEAIVLLASWASVAIANARAYDNEQRRRTELEQAVSALEATTTIARAIGTETDLDRVLELIVKRARALVDARGVLILLADRDELVIASVAGAIDDDVVGIRLPVEGTAGGATMRAGRVQRIADVHERLRFGLGGRLRDASALFVPLSYRSRPLGVLCAFDRGEDGEFTGDDERLLESFAASAATAVATAQDVADEHMRRSIEASERERRRWARELHDETLQELAGLKVLLAGARRSDDPAAMHRALDAALEQIDTEITGLRRLIADLRPAALDEFGTRSAVESLAERVSATSGLEIALDVDLAHESGRSERRPPAAIEQALYRLVQEALINAVKHADATRVTIAISEQAGMIELRVADDGRGFDPEAPSEGFGLLGMRERALLVGGELTIASRPGGGTAIRAQIPVGVAARAARGVAGSTAASAAGGLVADGGGVGDAGARGARSAR